MTTTESQIWDERAHVAASRLTSATTFMTAVERTPPDDRMHWPDAATEATDELNGAMAYAQAVLAKDTTAVKLALTVWPWPDPEDNEPPC